MKTVRNETRLPDTQQKSITIFSAILFTQENIHGDDHNKDGTSIYYKDWGEGQPIVFSHGMARLQRRIWDGQMLSLRQQGYSSHRT